MSEIVKVVTDFSNYERVLLFYKDKDEKVYIGHTFLYNGRDDSKYMLFLYKDALPKGNVIESWNYLDENSYNIVTIGVNDIRVAIDDFISVYNTEYNWSNLSYYEVNNFMEVDDIYDKLNFKKETAIGFVFR